MLVYSHHLRSSISVPPKKYNEARVAAYTRALVNGRGCCILLDTDTLALYLADHQDFQGVFVGNVTVLGAKMWLTRQENKRKEKRC